jgi:hypothetical protein
MRNLKTMNRRRFLRGLGGATVALPFLESFASRTASAQAAGAAKRFVVFFTCNGVNMEKYFPTSGFGALTADSLAGTSLSPLADYAGKLLIPRGITQVPEGYGREGNGCDHAKGTGSRLTCRNLQATDEKYAEGISVDQEIAQAINPMGREAMTLFAGWRGTGGGSHISYRGAGQPVSGENNPWLVYRDFMGLGAPPGTSTPDADEALERVVKRKQSVLDLVRSEFESLKLAGLGKADREKLDLHFSTIRDVETTMTGGGSSSVSCNLPQETATELMNINPDTVGDEINYKMMGTLLLDVMALAIACDHTRVATIQWGGGAGGPVFKWDGMNHEVNHHKLSHGSFFDDCFPGDTREKCLSEPVGWQESLAQIDTWHAGRYKYLLDKLNAYKEPGGSVLDNSVVMWAHELADGRAHSWYNLPFVLAGSAGGFLKQGQHIDLTGGGGLDAFWDKKAPQNRLLITCMQAMGMDRESFGDPAFAPATGAFSELIA